MRFSRTLGCLAKPGWRFRRYVLVEKFDIGEGVEIFFFPILLEKTRKFFRNTTTKRKKKSIPPVRSFFFLNENKMSNRFFDGVGGSYALHLRHISIEIMKKQKYTKKKNFDTPGKSTFPNICFLIFESSIFFFLKKCIFLFEENQMSLVRKVV